MANEKASERVVLQRAGTRIVVKGSVAVARGGSGKRARVTIDLSRVSGAIEPSTIDIPEREAQELVAALQELLYVSDGPPDLVPR